jgi:hypothetical protein
MPVTVIPHKHWRHVSGRTASIYGASPWTSQADKPNWTLVERGYTTLNPDGTVGCGRPPCATIEEAQALADRQNAIGFTGMNQG